MLTIGVDGYVFVGLVCYFILFFPGRYYAFGMSCVIRYLFSCLHLKNISDNGLIILFLECGRLLPLFV